jgi:macrolide transport system ATP-binding/permease protein
MELIRLENIVKTYHVGEVDVPVLKGVSFSIQRGELVALMGASGSGKSTLMNILGCLDRPTSGRYWFDGEEVGDLAPNERALVRTAKLGFVFQSFNLLSRTTALENVLMPLDYSPMPHSSATAHERAHRLLDRVGLSDRLDHIPSQMSGGQQQRVAIARALINEPALLLADEPTGNLDSHTSVEILEMFQELNAAGITIILVTHDAKVASYAHRTIHVSDGLVLDENGQSLSQPPDSGPHPHLARGRTVGPRLIHGDSSPGDEKQGWQTREELTSAGGAVSTMQTRRLQRRSVAKSATSEPAIETEKPSIRPGVVSLLPTTLRTAINALRRNKMRAALTTLGVVIGVAAVIAMVEISQGSRTALLRTMSSLGANNLIVQSGAAASGGISWGQGSSKTLTPQDAEELVRQCSGVFEVAPMVGTSGQVVRGNKNWIPMNIYGTTPSYLAVRDWENMDEGEMFTDQDVRGAVRVCVIGRTLARELFEGESPVGQSIRVKNVSLRVLGVLGPKGASMMGMDQDDVVLAPWTTVKYRISGMGASAAATAGTTTGAGATSTTGTAEINSLNKLYPGTTTFYPVPSATQLANTPQPVRFTNVDTIQVKAVSAEQIKPAIAQMTELLRERHRIGEGEADDFSIRDMSEFIKMMTSTSQMMGVLLLIVALISLAVGGVGIMNIMLVSVTERTREIGLRMAVGARSHHIMRQFLIEAVVLCLFGGAIGIALGRVASTLVWYFMRWPVQASIPAIIAAFGVSATIGIGFGFYPAWKASRLDPIEALRYE